MKKRKELLGLLNKNKKALFILVCCVALLVFAVVQSVSDGKKINGEDNTNIQANGQINKPQQDTQSGTNNTPEDESTELVGVEAVADIDEYFAGLRVANGDMESQQQQVCNDIRTSILTRGYEDAFVCITNDDTLEITILCSELTEAEVNVIANTALDFFEILPENMTVKGVCGI